MPTKIWNSFTAAPHRVMFFGGALQAVAVMVWWLVELVTRYEIAGHPLTWTIAPSAAHAYLMIYGLFPFFMFGFLMTVFPRWMNGQEIQARYYVPAFIFLILGAVCFYVGLLGNETVLRIATASTLTGWGVANYALLRVLLDTQHPEKQHPKTIFVALSLGWCSLASYLVWLASDLEVFLHVAIQGGLWLFLLPVFASAGHRMIPFFTSSALPHHVVKRTYWPWWVVLTASAIHGLLQFFNLASWLWASDLPLAFAALQLTYSWGVHRSLRIPLLSILHIGFLWMGIAMLLSSVQSLMSFSSDGATQIWGFAPLHALTMGCFATLLIGFGTRVTLGHSGLPMQVNKPVLLMFAGIQLATIVRVLADLLPIQIRYWLYVSAAIIWLTSFFPWVLRYLPVYLRPREDGRAG